MKKSKRGIFFAYSEHAFSISLNEGSKVTFVGEGEDAAHYALSDWETLLADIYLEYNPDTDESLFSDESGTFVLNGDADVFLIPSVGHVFCARKTDDARRAECIVFTKPYLVYLYELPINDKIDDTPYIHFTFDYRHYAEVTEIVKTIRSADVRPEAS